MPTDLKHEVAIATAVGGIALFVCKVCGLVWAPELATNPVCPTKLAARLPRQLCRMRWVPGVLSRHRTPVRCSLDLGHEGDHFFPGVTDRPALEPEADDTGG